MSRGFLWFAQNNAKTDYVELSIKLAQSIKKYNYHNKVCVVTDKESKIESKHVDHVKVLKEDLSETHSMKWANEFKAFAITPFTHTIKIEADMAWTLKTSSRFTGEIRFCRSTDGGENFETPRTINDDNLFTGHRFESLFLVDSGHLYLTWVDKRDLEASVEAGEDYAGAAIYYAVSDDDGASFSQNYRVANNSCECCRIAIAPRGPENIAILWRQVFGEDVRDHAIAELTPSGKTLTTNRASYDQWHINACPHHGPTMVQSSLSGDYHMSWFTNGDLNQGIYYARYSFDDGRSASIFQVDGQPGAGHPFLSEHNEKLHLVWKGFNGRETLLNLITSEDDGATWSEPTTLLKTDKGSAHPLLIQNSDSLFLSWHSDEFGYVLLDVSENTRRLSNNEN